MKADEELKTLSDLYKGALNMERECIDLFGVRFRGVSAGLLIEPENGINAPLRKPLTSPKQEVVKDGQGAHHTLRSAALLAPVKPQTPFPFLFE